ncbi:MAG: OmpA family protein [Alphaproteobacteria bacterium]|nr:OmpA family protein [Alphaproteobacteria bacterium]
MTSLSPNAHAQMPQGYTDEKPNVTIDRSVLQDLKDYEPPPMFGNDLMPPVTNRVDTSRDELPSIKMTAPKPEALPAKDPNKALNKDPKVEDLLNHPTENFHVHTERNAASPAALHPSHPVTVLPKKNSLPQNDGPLLPLPEDPPLRLKPPEQKKSNLEKKEKSGEKSKENHSSGKDYKPKTTQTMPAVPPIKVEKAALLPILPPINLPPVPQTATQVEKPSPGLRMIDAALEQQIESDETRIKEKLINPSDRHKPTPPILSTDSKTLVFKTEDFDLSEKAKSQIKNKILPSLQKVFQSDSKSRIQIISFAGSPDQTESSARRISLSRALAVRDYLKTLNFDLSRVDIRALASERDATHPDKIDLVLLK